MSELSLNELDAQHGELLPEREALGRFTLNVGSNDHNHTVNLNQSNSVHTNNSVVLFNDQTNNAFIIN
jgi:hypothetical protein